MPKAQGTLDAFVSSRKIITGPSFTSQEIRDRGSTFVANIYHASTPQDAQKRVEQMKRVVHSSKPATHEISAWRCMVIKPGKSGLGGPEDFELQAGSKDDGESWAGARVLAVMNKLSILDAVVIVSRWYGGQMLGPARFDHIETCTREVCRKFKDQEEIVELRTLLETLDDILGDLRREYASMAKDSPGARPDEASAKRRQDYSSLDIPKARRLIRARENSIKSVKALIAKRQGDASLSQDSGVATSIVARY